MTRTTKAQPATLPALARSERAHRAAATRRRKALLKAIAAAAPGAELEALLATLEAGQVAK